METEHSRVTVSPFLVCRMSGMSHTSINQTQLTMNSSRPSLALLWLIVLAGAPQLNALSSLNSKSKKNVASTRITTLPILSLTTAATTATTRQVSRTQFLDGMIMSSIYLIGSPLAAHATADIIDQMASKTALRNVKSAQRKLLAMKALYCDQRLHHIERIASCRTLFYDPKVMCYHHSSRG